MMQMRMLNTHLKLLGRHLSVVIACGLFQQAQADMQSLEDEALSGVSGQSGMTLKVETDMSIGEVAYFDDGLGIALQGVRLTKAGDRTVADWERFVRHELVDAGVSDTYANLLPFEANTSNLAATRLDIDILDNSTLSLDFISIDRSRFEIGDIRFINTPGLTAAPAAPSIGGLFFDFQLDGHVDITGAGTATNPIYGTLFNIDLLFENARFGYRTNGNEFFLDGMTIDVESPGTVLTYDIPNNELDISLPSFKADIYADAIRFSNNPANHGVSVDVATGLPLSSYGSMWATMDLTSNIGIAAGGAAGSQGITLNSQTTINWLDFAWGDDIATNSTPGWVGALGVTGNVNVNNLYIDVLADPDAGIEPARDFGHGLMFDVDRIDANLRIEEFVIADSIQRLRQYSQSRGGRPVNTVGTFEANLILADGLYEGNAQTNRILLQAGGHPDAGYQGLRLDTRLSVISPSNESNFVYTDNGNSLMWSRFSGYADGDLTLNVTNAGTLNGTTFYDGLRLGFEDFAFGYQIEGYRVAEDSGNSADLNNQELQAATAIPGMPGLPGIGAAPALEGTLNGHITIGPEGRLGEEGLTINADLSISDGSLAHYLEGDGTGRGLWLSGLNYDVHLRDMLVDVTDQGIEIYETENWGVLDVTDFRLGDKATGASFGRVVMEHHELGSFKRIIDGGAGNVCVGGVGATQTACETDSGFWSSRGSEGLSISSIRHLAAANNVENKRNRFTWEVSRTGEGTNAVVNGSGMQLVFDNFTTNDGNGSTDTYGIRTVTHVDIAQTRVVKKSNGADENGVVGNRGDEKVMNSDGTYRYVAPGSMTGVDISDRPVGLAVRNTTSFRELDIDNVNLVHPTGGESTLLYGVKLQNFEVRTDITATPMD